MQRGILKVEPYGVHHVTASVIVRADLS